MVYSNEIDDTFYAKTSSYLLMISFWILKSPWKVELSFWNCSMFIFTKAFYFSTSSTFGSFKINSFRSECSSMSTLVSKFKDVSSSFFSSFISFFFYFSKSICSLSINFYSSFLSRAHSFINEFFSKFFSTFLVISDICFSNVLADALVSMWSFTSSKVLFMSFMNSSTSVDFV